MNIFKDTYQNCKYQGMTLLEIMSSVTVLSLMLSLGAPLLEGILRKNQLRLEASEVMATLVLTRSEAVSRNIPVSMCHTNDGNSCAGNLDQHWQGGWLVFTDIDKNHSVDAGDRILAVRQAPRKSISVGANINSKALTYNPSGRVSRAGRFRVCAVNISRQEAFSIVVSPTGRPRLANGSDMCP